MKRLRIEHMELKKKEIQKKIIDNDIKEAQIKKEEAISKAKEVNRSINEQFFTMLNTDPDKVYLVYNVPNVFSDHPDFQSVNKNTKVFKRYYKFIKTLDAQEFKRHQQLLSLLTDEQTTLLRKLYESLSDQQLEEAHLYYKQHSLEISKMKPEDLVYYYQPITIDPNLCSTFLNLSENNTSIT